MIHHQNQDTLKMKRRANQSGNQDKGVTCTIFHYLLYNQASSFSLVIYKIDLWSSPLWSLVIKFFILR